MILFLTNLLLALAWMAMAGSAGWASFLMGFAVSYAVIAWLGSLIGQTGYTRKLPQAIGFVFFILWQLILSNLRVAYDVITPAANRSPAVIGVPLDVTTDAQITLLANLITLTPGTLSLDLSEDRKTLYIHAMFAEDREAFCREIKDGFERRVLELLR
ncbi:Na+/H+ antiporter subunit E [Algisphaera agarilytica]|uniref:Multicomponent Na+:H+ antiporter subunit E n=1 Tax=Algisphaera agarilytica TaxID=1385975 RepID=A0A7X0LJ57_9BACT|nr:Na+/H+ antiporter subunit E [Algisphaera agarilytica]MBB6428444.1 multicomponent Na+:H+ antiporter subunit E [Algisphaera agarilytica]